MKRGKLLGRAIAKRRVRSAAIVIDAPGLDQNPRFGDAREPVLIQAFVAEPLIEPSMYGFWTGFPGAMKCSATRR